MSRGNNPFSDMEDEEEISDFLFNRALGTGRGTGLGAVPEGNPGAKGLGTSSGAAGNHQEVSSQRDIQACWNVIIQQADMLHTQQQMLTNLNDQMASMKDMMAQLIKDKHSSPESSVSLTDLASLLDKRGAPPPSSFDIASGQSFCQFFEQFEQYCTGKYANGTYERWTGELKDFLKGEILNIYNLHGGGEVKLSTMKKKLEEYCAEEDRSSQSRKIEKFVSAHLGPDEPLHMYALRLERLYLSVHPNQPVENNIELHSKFMNTISNTDKVDLQRDLDLLQVFSKTDSTPWSSLKIVLKQRHERLKRVQKYTVKEETNPPVWFTSSNVSMEPNKAVNFKKSASKPTNYRPSNPGNQNSHYQRTRSFSVDRSANQTTSREPRSQTRTFSNQNYRSRSLSRNNNNRQQAPFNHSNQSDVPVCHWCGIPGHIKSNCWRRQGLCFRCGSSEHQVLNCPQPDLRSNHPRPSQTTPSPSVPNISPNLNTNATMQQVPVVNTAHTGAAPRVDHGSASLNPFYVPPPPGFYTAPYQSPYAPAPYTPGPPITPLWTQGSFSLPLSPDARNVSDTFKTPASQPKTLNH